MLRKDGGNPFEQECVVKEVKKLVHDLYMLYSLNISTISKALKEEKKALILEFISYKDKRRNNILQLWLQYVDTCSFSEKQETTLILVTSFFSTLSEQLNIDEKNLDGDTTLRTLFLSDISYIYELYIELLKGAKCLEFSDILRCEKSRANFVKHIIENDDEDMFYKEFKNLYNCNMARFSEASSYGEYTYNCDESYAFLRKECEVLLVIYFGELKITEQILNKKLKEFLNKLYCECYSLNNVDSKLHIMLLDILIKTHNKYESSKVEVIREAETTSQEQQNIGSLLNNKANFNRDYEEKFATCSSNCCENLRVVNMKHRYRQSIFATQVVKRCVVATQKKEDALGLWEID